MLEEVIELSVEETNKLRAELGLAPLRVPNDTPPPQQHQGRQSTVLPTTTDHGEEVLELSVDESNALREKLGLKPLRTSARTQQQVIHKPPENKAETNEVAERIAAAKLRRQVQVGVKTTFGEATLADDIDTSALSWADQMRKKKGETEAGSSVEPKKTKRDDENYNEDDLEGLQVAHNMDDLEAGTTTVLTLADAPLLSTSLDHETSKLQVGLNDGDVALENVSLTENKKQQDGLRKKRMLELGMGRAGGYAGFDDEEFEELGGTLGPSKRNRINPLLGNPIEEGKASRGFRIGVSKEGSTDGPSTSDFDKIQMGKAISLVPERADVVSSDFLTLEEEEAERAARKRTKDGKFSKKKKHKKEKKHRKTPDDSGVEDKDDDQPSTVRSNNEGRQENILETLEETAAPVSSGLRKRRWTRDDEDNISAKPTPIDRRFGEMKHDLTSVREKDDRQAKFDAIMAKGNERAKQAFSTKAKEPQKDFLDEEPDDSFLNAALAKARRLNRLRELNKPASNGADAVAEAVKASVAANDATMKNTTNGTSTTGSSSSPGGISFSIDHTREFTLALQARAQQKEREAEKGKQQRAIHTKANQLVKDVVEDQTSSRLDDEKEEVVVATAEDECDVDMDMDELAKEVKTDDLVDSSSSAAFEGSTSRSVGVGRGLSSFVSMLKTTGEISDKNAKEELKGRAKDERNYENYAPLDLAKVVKIGRNATDKDRELAHREIKLEYRDKHGRLLTTKEAYRDLCYQFHGHGASKKKEEKHLKQIEREHAQTRMVSQQVAAARDGSTTSSLGALKATQKATGKAFIVHKM